MKFTTENCMTRDGQDVVIYEIYDGWILGRVGPHLKKWRGSDGKLSGYCDEHHLDLVPKRAVFYANQRTDGTWSEPRATEGDAGTAACINLDAYARIAVKFIEAEDQLCLGLYLW